MQNEISVLIIEDEEIWIESLSIILKDFGFTVARVASTVEDALNALSNCEYDIILLDITLHGRNSGIELARIINKLYRKPFIFITANNGHNLKEAADSNPSAYLPKPLNPSSLFIAIQNAINNFSTNQSAAPQMLEEEAFSFFVKQGSRYKKIDWKDVVYLSAAKNYISVFNSGDKTEYFIRSSLQKTLQYIIPKQMQKMFLQVNRSEVVQFSFIMEVSNDEIKTQYRSFAISEAYTKELKARLNIVS